MIEPQDESLDDPARFLAAKVYLKYSRSKRKIAPPFLARLDAPDCSQLLLILGVKQLLPAIALAEIWFLPSVHLAGWVNLGVTPSSPQCYQPLSRWASAVQINNRCPPEPGEEFSSEIWQSAILPIWDPKICQRMLSQAGTIVSLAAANNTLSNPLDWARLQYSI